MSGGSYDYLCWHEFLDKESLLEQMQVRLKHLGYRLAADDTARVLSALRDIDGDKRLREAWRLVEWLDSSDIGLDQLHERMGELGWKTGRSAG